MAGRRREVEDDFTGAHCGHGKDLDFIQNVSEENPGKG